MQHRLRTFETVGSEVMYDDVSGLLLVNGAPLPASANLQVAQITLTAAQMLALRATPIQIVPAPLANQYVNIVDAFAEYVFNTTGYTIGSGGHIDFVIGTQDSKFGFVATGFIDQTASMTQKVVPDATPALLTKANTAGQAVSIKNIGSAEYTLGDGSVVVTLMYNLITLT